VLSPHNLLIAVIFVPYVVMMAALGVYIYRTSRPRDRDEAEPPDSSDEKEDGLPGLPLAA
jgi:hypothetical protein